MVNTEQTFFNANDAVWPALSSLTGILLRWIVLTWIGWNWPRGSGPSNKVSFSRMVPRRHVPDTTVPTPWKLEKNNHFDWFHLPYAWKQLKCHELSCFREIAHIKDLKNYVERLPFVNVNFRLLINPVYKIKLLWFTLPPICINVSFEVYRSLYRVNAVQLFGALAIFSRHRFNSHTINLLIGRWTLT